MIRQTSGKRVASRGLLSRAVAAGAAALLLLALVIVPPAKIAAAPPSLPYIEALRARVETGGSFRVLELLADLASAPTGIGYYMDGHEPAGLAEYPLFQAATTLEERADAAAAWQGSLPSAVSALVGDAAFPLSFVPYSEVLYWEDATSHPHVLNLAAQQLAADVLGVRTESPNGAYNTRYTYVPDTTAGSLLLRGGYLVRRDAAPADGLVHFYYDMDTNPARDSFKALLETELFNDDYVGKPIYGQTKADGTFEFINYYAAGVLSKTLFETYANIYVGAYHEADVRLTHAPGLYELVDYTVVDTAEQPLEPGEAAFLSRTIDGLTLVGSGGDCNFEADSDGDAFDIIYSMIRYAGGFENHNWFSRFVLDADETAAGGIEYTVVQRVVADATFTAEQFLSYDLIVVGSGIGALPTEAINAIMGNGVSPVPTLFVEAADALLTALGITAPITDTDSNYVDGTRYFYTPMSADAAPGFEGLFTASFNVDFNRSSAMNGFEPVLRNITDENNLRKISGMTEAKGELLPEYISIATSLRYILNQRVPRTVHPLTQVRILEIEPAHIATHIISPTNPLPGVKYLHKSDTLDPTDALNVMNWLQGVMIVEGNTPRPVVADDVTITRMSPNALNGKIENLKEQYEIIYFGDSRGHFPLNAAKTETVFNRSNLNGLLYMNIGDAVVKADFVTLGLMDSDYNTAKTAVNKADDNRTLLMAGNDITAAKRAEIEAFAAAGYPVVFANDLVSETDPLLPDTVHVDRWTHLYDAMATMLPRENAFTVKQLLSGNTLYSEAFQSAISLSKPSIIFSVNGGTEMIPTPYAINGTDMTANTTGRQLRYQFKISDPADPTPKDTTYQVRLYMDANASGRYTDDEVLYIDVYSASGVMLHAGDNGRYQLKADTEYRLEALLPQDAVGIVPWKLEVEKNTTATGVTFHGSRTGYTRVAPASDGERKELKVLQIVGWDQYQYDLSNRIADRGNTLTLENSTIYTDLIAQLKDFAIDFDTIRNDGSRYQEETSDGKPMGTFKAPTVHKLVDGVDFWKGLNYSVTPSGRNFDDDVNTIYNILNKYDMLIIGFADCYEGINDTLAKAIFRYIGAGKAVLFTHDTTSFINMPKTLYTAGGVGAGGGYWAYSFNQILRPAVGMDYYGISAPAFRDVLAAQNSTTNKIGDSTIAALKASGYNIAYKPNSDDGTGKPIPEQKTHGYATYLFKKTDNNFRPDRVTQLNAGQITTYPFDINLAGFSDNPSAKSMLAVQPTHFQYYSLNMNIDDLVVWYCLADSGKVNSPDAEGNYYHTNDASNGYYIYTMGNVTYSGVGHSYGTNNEEAKLFINTMIAAYRSSSISSEVTAKDKDDRASSYIYFPFDGDALLKREGADTQSEMYAAYFSFSDSSVVGGVPGKSTATFYYSMGEEDQYATDALKGPFDAEIYSATGKVPENTYGEQLLSRNTLYHIYLPQPVLSQLADHDALRVYFVVTTNYASRGEIEAYASIELRKIGLLPLQ